MTAQIWLIGGTQESAVLAIALAQAAIPFVVTVTTDAAKAMYGKALEQFSQAKIHVGPIPLDSMATWLNRQSIAGVIDASHPFATAVSAGAIAATIQTQLPYLRFERSVVQSSVSSEAEHVTCSASNVTLVPQLETLLTPGQLVGQRVLLVLGYRMLHHFQPWQEQGTLFARILPSQTALEAAFQAGFTSDRLIALRPPISPDLERSLWQQWGITKVIAKCSGKAGGENTKRAIAATLGIPLCLIQRPTLDYPAQTHDVAEAIAFAQQLLWP